MFCPQIFEIGRKPFVEPDITPSGEAYAIAKPLMAEFMGDGTFREDLPTKDTTSLGLQCRRIIVVEHNRTVCLKRKRANQIAVKLQHVRCGAQSILDSL